MHPPPQDHSYWTDNLTREFVLGGELERLMLREDLRGATSSPQVVRGAIQRGHDYDAQINEMATAGLDAEQIYEQLVVTDVRSACDVLRRAYDATGGQDGFVSLGLSPRMAHDSHASLTHAQRLFRMVERENCLIKIPASAAGLVAAEEALFEGVNINVTLVFSIPRLEGVSQAYLRALERRLEAGRSIEKLACAVTFSPKPVEILVDRLLSHRTQSQSRSPESEAARAQPSSAAGASSSGPRPEQLLGRTAAALCELARAAYLELVRSDRWQALEEQGARRQQLLWASAADTRRGVGPAGLASSRGRDRGRRDPAWEANEPFAAARPHGEGPGARQVLADLEVLGIRLELITHQLENEGLQALITAHEELVGRIETVRQRQARQRHVPQLLALAQKLRADVIRMTSKAGSGHPTSCLSCADLVAALFFQQMRWDPGDPETREVDQFVLSKGHAAPILWAALAEAGALADDIMTLRHVDSSLEGHPTPQNPWIRVATGSLGQGLSAANGIALANQLDGIPAKVYCLLGDGECSEGSVWEAAQFASLHGLSGVVAIVDVNGLGQSAPAPYRHDAHVFQERFAAFGWRTQVIDGHDLTAITDALYEAAEDWSRPTAILAITTKGKGVSFLAGQEGWHGKVLSPDQEQLALAELGNVSIQLRVRTRRVGSLGTSVPSPPAPDNPEPAYAPDEQVATREAVGRALAKLGAAHRDLVVIDADVSNSTHTAYFAEEHASRFIQGYIAEQNATGVALGLASAGKTALFATFSAFLTRAYDFIRMAAHSNPGHLVFVGTHAGVSVGEDGPSQMGLEDLAMFRALPGSTVLCPSDGISAERLTELALGQPGIVYIRATRGKTPMLYRKDERFTVGGSRVLRASPRDILTLVATGITVYEALAAHETLKAQDVLVRVIDCYSIKPIDVSTLREAAQRTGRLVVIEDHWPEGGLGDAVSTALEGAVPVHRLAVTGRPRSGAPEQLLARHGISRASIVNQVLLLQKIEQHGEELGH